MAKNRSHRGRVGRALLNMERHVARSPNEHDSIDEPSIGDRYRSSVANEASALERQRTNFIAFA